MEERLWRGDWEEKNGFSREGMNRSLQDTAAGPAGPHPGVCLQDSFFNTDGRAPGLAPRKLGPLGSHVWPLREGLQGGKLVESQTIAYRAPRKAFQIWEVWGHRGGNMLTSRRGEAKRVPHSQRGAKRRPGEQPGPNIPSSSFGWALGCRRLRGVEGDLMLGRCLRQGQ